MEEKKTLVNVIKMKCFGGISGKIRESYGDRSPPLKKPTETILKFYSDDSTELTCRYLCEEENLKCRIYGGKQCIHYMKEKTE